MYFVNMFCTRKDTVKNKKDFNNIELQTFQFSASVDDVDVGVSAAIYTTLGGINTLRRVLITLSVQRKMFE